jgi:hypothetical protein
MHNKHLYVQAFYLNHNLHGQVFPRSTLTASIAQATNCPGIKTHKQTKRNTDGDASAFSLPNTVIIQENTCLVVQCHEQGEGSCGGGEGDSGGGVY